MSRLCHHFVTMPRVLHFCKLTGVLCHYGMHAAALCKSMRWRTDGLACHRSVVLRDSALETYVQCHENSSDAVWGMSCRQMLGGRQRWQC